MTPATLLRWKYKPVHSKVNAIVVVVISRDVDKEPRDVDSIEMQHYSAEFTRVYGIKHMLTPRAI